uniref:probable methyltransferase-like protein 15 isoform X2 n=1 Tax=Ciona intestinalis TaxID=7719 RepID=UPI00089DCAA2|nr:probable methyltransferase-like protein 15 isoform X2 [Ciona intestinalis]|eukprot:XP_026690931.1 probable methyltransferase-like protein 15 isoform X2 [Ciona intestinalis]
MRPIFARVIRSNFEPCTKLFRMYGKSRPNSKETALHIPVMAEELVSGLNIKRGDVIIDMTFGAGGHTKFIMENYKHCKVIALDRDEKAFEIAQDLSKKFKGRIIPLLGKFSELDKLLSDHGIVENSLNAVLLDAGCSSMQFDQPERGFSLVRDGPLDMRMDGNRSEGQITAADVVNNLDEEELTEIIYKYGDERNARNISSSIIENRPISTTLELARVVSMAFSQTSDVFRVDSLGRRCHIATKTFMAIRIFVNDELNEICHGIKTSEKYLMNGGKMGVITFHSLEDRVVKRMLKQIEISKPFNVKMGVGKRSKTERRYWKREQSLLLPSGEEIEQNPRSRSAKLRIATRCRDG